eukprot:Awhi_evm4s1786
MVQNALVFGLVLQGVQALPRLRRELPSIGQAVMPPALAQALLSPECVSIDDRVDDEWCVTSGCVPDIYCRDPNSPVVTKPDETEREGCVSLVSNIGNDW